MTSGAADRRIDEPPADASRHPTLVDRPAGTVRAAIDCWADNRRPARYARSPR